MTESLPDGVVRRLGVGDVDLVVRWCSQHKARVPTREAAASFLMPRAHAVLMAFEHDQPVGMLYGYALDRIDGRRMGLIYDLEVVEQHRRRGHGRRLLQSALQLFDRDGALAVWLTTGRDNDLGRMLYQNAGAEEIDDVLYQWVLRAG